MNLTRTVNGAAPPFEPPLWLRGGHRQTLFANYAPRDAAGRELAAASRPVVVSTADDDRLRIHWWRDGRAERPVLVVLHGLTGCADSPNVLGIAAKAARRGFDVVRVDLRNASGATPSREVGHAGRSDDLRAVIDHVRESAPGAPIAVVGHSLGGNVAVKAAGEYGAAAPAELCGVAAISVPIDLAASCAGIDRPPNRVYRHYFVRRLRATLEQRLGRNERFAARLRRRRNDGRRRPALDRIASVRDFDEAVVAPMGGFADADDYYRRCSALGFVEHVRIPTRLIHAIDDPFVPTQPYADHRVTANPLIEVLLSERGGHVGFFAARRRADSDRFWAEHRAVEFCAVAAGSARLDG